MSFSLVHLRYFAAAARHGSVTAAARALNVSQPSISAAIARLEEHYGRALLVRQTGRGVVPTPFGAATARRARELIAAFDDLAAPEDADTPIAGEITLGCFEDLAPFFLPRLLRAFSACHPAAHVRIEEMGFEALARAVEEGAVDLALDYDVALPPGTARTTLRRLRPYAMLPADHRLAVREAVSLDELADETLILTAQPQSWQYILGLFRTRGLEPSATRRPGSFELQRGLVAGGQGVAVAYTRPAGDIAYDGGAIACRPIADDLPVQRIVLAEPGAQPLSRAAAALRDAAVDLYGDPSPDRAGEPPGW